MKNEFELIIGDHNLSSWSLRAWLMLKHVDVPFEEYLIRLDKSNTRTEILKYSPSGRVPALMHNGHMIWESLAIGEYLHELFPHAQLWPQDPIVRAFARSISNEMHAGFTVLREMMPFFLNDVKKMPAHPDLVADIHRIEVIFQECRSKYSKTGEYLFESFTIADAMFAPFILRFKTYGYYSRSLDIQDYCNLIQNNHFINEWISKAK